MRYFKTNSIHDVQHIIVEGWMWNSLSCETEIIRQGLDIFWWI